MRSAALSSLRVDSAILFRFKWTSMILATRIRIRWLRWEIGWMAIRRWPLCKWEIAINREGKLMEERKVPRIRTVRLENVPHQGATNTLDFSASRWSMRLMCSKAYTQWRLVYALAALRFSFLIANAHACWLGTRARGRCDKRLSEFVKSIELTSPGLTYANKHKYPAFFFPLSQRSVKN